MKKLKFLFLLLLIGTISCDKDESETQEPEPQIIGYSDVKNDNWRDKIGQEFEVEGTLVVENNAAKVLINPNDYYIDGLINEVNYIQIETSENLINELNLSE